MYIQSRRAYTQALVVLLLVLSCSNNAPVAPLETLQGNCVGVIKEASGALVKGASVFLVPEGYSPLSTDAGSGRIDSTTSDGFGRFGFAAAGPGSYNLLAKSGNLRTMRRSIRISADARVILDDEVLREPGSLAGTVHLRGESDHRPAIILLMGTAIYVKPSDSTGTFSVAALAQGFYTMRILTAKNDFAVVETTVTVTSGMQTALPCIELHKKYVPVIDSLSVFYDSVMMRAVLTWPALDTAKIKNFDVYCNRSRNLAPVAIVNKSVTTITFDIVASMIDTFRYQISAVGNDGIEGPPTEGKPFVNTSAIMLDKITHTVSLDKEPSDYHLFVDCKDNIYIVGWGKISKIDSKGTFLGEYSAAFHFNPYYTPGLRNYQMRTDTAGNLYVLTRLSDTLRLIKLDNNLKVVQELSIDTLRSGLHYSIAVSANGSVMLNVSYSYQTFTSIYDPQFRLIDSSYVLERHYIDYSVICGDTIVASEFDDFEKAYRVVYFDSSFKQISSPLTLDFKNDFNQLRSFVPPGYSPFGFFFLGSKDLFTIGYISDSGSSDLLVFIDSRKQAIARMPNDNKDYAGIWCDISFDLKGNFYSLSTTEKNILLKYSMAPVLKLNSK